MSEPPPHARRRRRRILLLTVMLAGFTSLTWWLQRPATVPTATRATPVAPPTVIAADTKVVPSILPETETPTPPAPIAAAGAGRSGIPSAATPLMALVAAPASAASLEARAPAPTRAMRYVVLDPAALTGKRSVFWQTAGGGFTMPLPEGDLIEIAVESTVATGPDRFVSQGVVVGVPGSRAMFALVDGRLAGSVEGLPGGEVAVRSLVGADGEDVVQLYRVAEDLVGECSAGPQQVVNADAWSAALAGAAMNRMAADAPLVSGQAVVDVLMAYTAAAREARGDTAAMLAQIDLAMAKVNADFSNSGITARVRLAGTLEVDYPEDNNPAGQSGWNSTTLTRLFRVTDGYLDAVHAKRDEVGADLVCLLVQRSDSGSNGIAYIMDDPGEFTESFFAFAVIQNANVSSTAVLSHEIGHLFGCAHARGDTGANGTHDGAYPYSYGHRWSATDAGGSTISLRSIMAYSPGTRIPYFSSPGLRPPSLTLFDGEHTFTNPPATGIAAGMANAADNARTIEDTAFQVANYRLSPTRSEAGRLINVSTRSFVGPGDQTLTGGFVLTGTGTKRVLVRAPGPVLATSPYFVPSVLVDPRLQIVRLGGDEVAANDDWELPAANGLAVTQVGESVGAFMLPAGGKDAAVVAELEPGPYTAVVTGVNGATGNALVEAYEVDGTGDVRMLNLSTRAHATMATPIVAGFVVERDPADPDARKTMFIRVRGPSLVNYGLAADAVMNDPFMSIYDATSQLVLVSDDWDAPTADLDGTGTNFVPVLHRGEVDQLSEQAVFDAASRFDAEFTMNPKEPGVVVEMPAGLYTVTVRPYESLPDQPGKPGIAIVEVYELVD